MLSELFSALDLSSLLDFDLQLSTQVFSWLRPICEGYAR